MGEYGRNCGRSAKKAGGKFSGGSLPVIYWPSCRRMRRPTVFSSPSTQARGAQGGPVLPWAAEPAPPAHHGPDRKSTRLNSSHVRISYAVFCLKKKNCRLQPLEYRFLLLLQSRI